MRLFALISFIIAFIMISSIALAQISYYGVDAYIDDKRVAHVKLSVTFDQPKNTFDFSVIGRVSNIKASSIAGPINCEMKSAGISFITCTMSLTQDKRSIEIDFDSDEFTQPLENWFYFSADFSLAEKIDYVYASFRLPEGTVLVKDSTNRISFPDNVTTITDGRNIIIVWQLHNINPIIPLRFQFIYEEVSPPPLFSIRLQYFIIMGVAAAGIILYILYWYRKRPEKIVLSVLDEFERMVVQSIDVHGGTVNQKKVVQDTNLSKAKVSRVVKSLMNRGLLEVERMGRTNKLKLIKKKLKI